MPRSQVQQKVKIKEQILFVCQQLHYDDKIQMKHNYYIICNTYFDDLIFVRRELIRRSFRSSSISFVFAYLLCCCVSIREIIVFFVVTVFPGLPSAPGMPCHGEDSKY